MIQDLSKYPTFNPTFQVSEEALSETHALIMVEPLEQGYGHTLGNALRRVLLTSLPGMAITSVRVDGVDHQYTTLEGLTEDVLELILNLRQVRVAGDVSTGGTLILDVKGPVEVTAGHIKAQGALSITNPDLHIASLAKGKNLRVEMTVEAGMGYILANERKSQTIGDIPLDSLFSPVIKASYKVENTRVGRKTDYDKLILDVQTDGSIKPIEAVQQSAQILAHQFSQVVSPTVAIFEEEAKLSPEEAEVLRLTVEELDLPTRIANALRKGGFKTVGDLTGAPKNVIAKVKNLGEKSVDVINEALMKKGVTLGD